MQLNRFNYRVPCNIAFSVELRHIVVFVRSQPTKETNCCTWMSRDKSSLKCVSSDFHIGVIICVGCVFISSKFNEKELQAEILIFFLQMVSNIFFKKKNRQIWPRGMWIKSKHRNPPFIVATVRYFSV